MLPRINELFAGRSVLITGSSGFLGKVLVEKLLYSVPSLKQIFLIIRHSRGVSPNERWQKITKDAIFDRVKKERPEALDKVIVIPGDLMEEHLGMNQHDIQQICEEVSLVFHCAATVKFDEKLRDAVEMNVRGTTRLVSLCHRMPKLAVLLHTSTAYANCDRQYTEEKVYPAPFDGQKLIESIEWMNDGMLAAVTPLVLGKRPNTYTLTKALAESMLVEEGRGLPVIIIRPSIVGAMWKDQLPGWTDNINGATGVFSAVGKGVLTNMMGDVKSKADIIPVDVVSNMLIVSAAYRMTLPDTEIPVMHCASGELNPIYWERIVYFLQQFYTKYPMVESFGVPSTQFHTSRFMFEVNYHFRHQIPAHFLDFLYALIGKKRINVRIHSKVRKMVETLHFFTRHGWSFETKALPMLWDCLDEADKKVFNFDVRQIDWDSYLFDYVMGIKKFLVKEDIDNCREARANLHRLRKYKLLTRITICTAIVSLLNLFRQQTTKRKVMIWLTSFLAIHTYDSYDYRPQYRLKSLQEYKLTTGC